MKTILITGSTDGIGKLAAMKLAKDGHEIYLHGRNAEKVEKVITEIKAESGNDKISGFVGDFSDINAVRIMADDIVAKLEKVDVLINNAGVFKSSVEKTFDGFDIRFAVNYFAPYILTEKLLPLLEKSEAPRVVNLSSAAQKSVSLDAMMAYDSLDSKAAYSQSKLALTMWNNHLAKVLPNINFIAVNPGSLLNTNMVAEAYGEYWSDADKGGNILCELAISDEFADTSGKYFDNDKGAFGDAHEDAYNVVKINTLVDKTKQILRKMSITIIPFEVSELSEAYPLFKRYLYNVIDESMGWDEVFQHLSFNARLKPEWFYWVTLNDEKVGLICHRYKADSLHVHLLIIFQPFQRKGYAQQSTTYLIELAKSRQKKVTLSCFKNNKAALSMYEKLGFVVCDEDEYFYDLVR